MLCMKLEPKILYESLIREHDIDTMDINRIFGRARGRLYLAIAYDVIHKLSKENRELIAAEPKVYEYSYGLGLAIRNDYFYKYQKLRDLDADNGSEGVLYMIFAILIPEYDPRSDLIIDLYKMDRMIKFRQVTYHFPHDELVYEIIKSHKVQNVPPYQSRYTDERLLNECMDELEARLQEKEAEFCKKILNDSWGEKKE